MNDRHDLERSVERKVQRMRQAERERQTVLSQTVYIGTIGLLFVLPIVGGAYLGRWLDARLEGYSVQWTTSLIVVGAIIGAINVYLLIREQS